MGGVLVAFADAPPLPPDGGWDWAGGPVSGSCAAAVANRETRTMQAKAAPMSTASNLIDSPRGNGRRTRLSGEQDGSRCVVCMPELKTPRVVQNSIRILLGDAMCNSLYISYVYPGISFMTAP